MSRSLPSHIVSTVVHGSSTPLTWLRLINSTPLVSIILYKYFYVNIYLYNEAHGISSRSYFTDVYGLLYYSTGWSIEIKRSNFPIKYTDKLGIIDNIFLGYLTTLNCFKMILKPIIWIDHRCFKRL